jgi:hypothetical protein
MLSLDVDSNMIIILQFRFYLDFQFIAFQNFKENLVFIPRTQLSSSLELYFMLRIELYFIFF